ncbi:MAG: class I SAM-dependent methyltransferase [Verrucomicrobia bacterium]|nr:class I SAM-dependent methyltransferase [Verrucomicrobiota bacterium]
MSDGTPYRVVDGIRCYHPEVALSYADYPDGGFDLTDKHAASSFWVSSRNRLFKSLVYGHMVPMGATRFLEIGCGTGDFIQRIVQNRRLAITGSEIYLKGLLYAKRNLPGVDFIQLDVTRGRVDEEFDQIVAFDVLEHIVDDVSAISNIGKMLHQGGVFILSVPQYMFLWSKLDEIVKHKRRYSRRELVTKLEGNGFKVSYATSFVFALFPLMLLSRLCDKGRAQLPSDDAELERRVTFPRALNWTLDLLMRIDEALIRMGISLPFGGTLVVVASKR